MGNYKAFVLTVLRILRVVLIILPQHGIGFDVIGFVLQILFVADDVFVIIALPDACGVVFASDAFCNRRFE